MSVACNDYDIAFLLTSLKRKKILYCKSRDKSESSRVGIIEVIRKEGGRKVEGRWKEGGVIREEWGMVSYSLVCKRIQLNMLLVEWLVLWTSTQSTRV